MVGKVKFIALMSCEMDDWTWKCCIHSFQWEILEGLGNHRLKIEIGWEMFDSQFLKGWEITDCAGKQVGNVGIHSFWWEILEGLGNHRLNVGIIGEMWDY